MKYLLDTNVISEPLRPQPDPQVLARLRLYQADVAISTLVWHELWFGCLRLPHSAKRARINDYLANIIAPNIPILPYDESAAEWHARERTRLTSIGRTPPFVDGQIAAIARSQNLVLVTRNVVDFRLFDGLEVVDWTER